jgi:hypothetical protein
MIEVALARQPLPGARIRDRDFTSALVRGFGRTLDWTSGGMR